MFNDFFDFNNDGELDSFERAAEYHCYKECTKDNDEYDDESLSFDWDLE